MKSRATTYRTKRGFTFVELLAAMLFMAIVFPAALYALSVANRTGVMAQRKRIAAELASAQLNEVLATGQWSTGESSGDFGESYPEYSWKLHSDNWTASGLYLLTIEVTFPVQGISHAYSLSAVSEEPNSNDTNTVNSGVGAGTVMGGAAL